MRNIIMAFFLGVSVATSVLGGAEAVDEGGWTWILELIVFPLIALAVMVFLLLGKWKRAPTDDRRPNSVS